MDQETKSIFGLLVTASLIGVLTVSPSISTEIAKRKQHFKSWASYGIPMRPVEPIPYSDTENLTSYYLAFYDDDNNLIKFVKYLREVQHTGNFVLEQPRSPKTILYFDTLIDKENRITVGKEIEYTLTENRSIYYKGVVNTDGLSVNMDLIYQNIFFTDEYSYWPNKKLKERVMQKKDGTITRSLYDKSGKELPLDEK